jgi:hypothetical protein
MHQGGIYYNENITHGILLKKEDFGGTGCHFGDRVIITRLACHSEGSGTCLATIHRAALETMNQQKMVGIIVSRDF